MLRPALTTFERVVVNRVRVREGDGTAGSPVRIVTYYLHDDGSAIVRVDPIRGLDDE